MQTFEKKIWMYWENKPGYKRPAYLELALETIEKNSGEYEVVMLNEKTVENYISIPNTVNRLNHLAHKADYIRFQLLYKYGGVWLDSDMILLRDIGEAVDPYIKDYEFVSCGIEHLKPSIWFMASRKGFKLLKDQIDEIDDVLKKKKRFTLPLFKIKLKWLQIGYDILWKNTPRYDYYCHEYKMFAPTAWNEWETFNRTDIKTEDYLAHNPYAVTLYNEKMFPTYKDKTREEILEGDSLLSKLFRRALQHT